MKFVHPNCPECGQAAVGTYERVPGIACLSEPDSETGEQDYAGSTEMDWNEQSPVLGPAGGVVLVCGDDHFWDAADGAKIAYPSNLPLPPPKRNFPDGAQAGSAQRQS